MEAQIVKTDKYCIDSSSFLTYESRLESFEFWPSDSFPKPEQLARCGFYARNTPGKTWCFYCGRYKSDWSAFDNPWVEHAIMSSGCPFLLLNRSTQSSYNWNSLISTAESQTLFESCQVS